MARINFMAFLGFVFITCIAFGAADKRPPILEVSPPLVVAERPYLLPVPVPGESNGYCKREKRPIEEDLVGPPIVVKRPVVFEEPVVEPVVDSRRRMKRSGKDIIDDDSTVGNKSAHVGEQVGRISVADDVDLCFLVDVTGSMSPFIQAVKDSVHEIVQNLQNSTDGNAVRDMRISFVGYRDHSDENHFEVLDFTREVASFSNFVTKTTASGGGDLPEDVHGGLDRALKLEWGDSSRTRLIFLMADAPSHGCDNHLLSSDSYTKGDPNNITFTGLFNKLQKMNIQFFFGNITATTDTMLERMSEAYGKQVNVIDLGIDSRSDGVYGGSAYDSGALRSEVYSAVYGSVRAAVAEKKAEAEAEPGTVATDEVSSVTEVMEGSGAPEPEPTREKRAVEASDELSEMMEAMDGSGVGTRQKRASADKTVSVPLWRLDDGPCEGAGCV